MIPKTLSVNAAQDATELVAALRAEHFKMQHDETPDPQLKFAGLDLVGGVVRDNLKFGVVSSGGRRPRRKKKLKRVRKWEGGEVKMRSLHMNKSIFFLLHIFGSFAVLLIHRLRYA